jgi:hypothetical protein
MSPAGGAPASDLTVEQYAGISAAIADGYPLDAVLANEGLSPKAWPDADIAWKQRLVADPAAFESYRVRLGEAEDWLGRKVTPLDEDLAAWLGFLGAYAAHAAPFDLLAGLGLGLSDLGRLQRRWSKRLAADQELTRQATELAKSKPRAVPKVSAAKGVLLPFPWSKRGAPIEGARARAREEPASAGAGADFDLAQYAALLAELTIAPKEKERALARHGLAPSSLAALRARWDARIEADAAVAQDYRRLFAHHRARFEAALRSAGDLPRREAPAPAPVFAAHPDLIAAPAPVAAPSSLKKGAIAARPAPSALAGTSLTVDVPRGPALPFARGLAPKEIAEGAPDEPKPRRSSLGETALAVDVPRGPALPFAARAYAPPLTLEQHASLAVELAAAPEKTAETLARYRLTPEARAELDAHYREKIAASAEARAAWERAYHSYHAWLAANRRPAR